MVIAHGSGIDEIAFVALPIVVFVVLHLLNKRKARQRLDEQENEPREPKE